MHAKLRAAISSNRRLWIVLMVLVAVPFLVKVGWSSRAAQSPDSAANERKFKLYREYKDLPLEVRAIRNLHSKSWLKDLEIEVKNVSKKPIYSIVAYLMFPDDKGAEHVAIPLSYGDPKNQDLDRSAEPDDPHIEPGESYIFKIEERFQQGFEAREKGDPGAYRRFELWITAISFGDGTGVVNGRSKDYRKKTSITPSSDGQKKSAAFLD